MQNVFRMEADTSTGLLKDLRKLVLRLIGFLFVVSYTNKNKIMPSRVLHGATHMDIIACCKKREVLSGGVVL